MNRIHKFFQELRKEILKTVVLDTFINTVIIFLAANIVLLFFNIHFYYAILGAAVFFALSTALKYRRIKLRMVEEKNPDFMHMLRTARDNINSTSIVAAALFEEIIERSNKLLIGNLMNYRGIVLRLFIIFGLIVGSGFAVSYNYQKLHLSSIFDKYDLDFYKSPFSMTSDKGLTETDDIFGISSLARLGEDELNMELDTGISELDLTRLKEEQTSDFDTSTSSVNVKAVGALTSSDTGIKDDLEIVRAFNEKRMKIVNR